MIFAFSARYLCSFALFSLALHAQVAQPVIDQRGPLHGATYQILSSPPFTEVTSGVAPGSIFYLYGSGLGPEELVVGSAPYRLRLPDQDGGVEVHVRSLGTGKVMQASLLFVRQDQIAAILPPNFPIGAAEMRVWYGGQPSEPSQFDVVFSFPGLFTVTQDGHGRAIAQQVGDDGALTLNNLTSAAKPGQVVTLWATGVGLARKDDVLIYLGEDGEQSFPVEYAGPAPGLPGVDQINFRIPETAELGCYVRIVASGGGLGSGPAAISIAQDGGACLHPWGLSAERLTQIEAGAQATELSVSLSTQSSGQGGIATVSGSAGAWSAANLALNIIGEQHNSFVDPRPTCFSFVNDPSQLPPLPPFPPPGPFEPPPPPEGPGLAGTPWTLTGPDGQVIDIRLRLRSGSVDAYGADPLTTSLAEGQWTLRTPGGDVIGPLDATFAVASPPEATVPDLLVPGQDFVVAWPAGEVDPLDEFTVQLEFSRPLDEPAGTSYRKGVSCRSAPGSTQMTIPFSKVAPGFEDFSEGQLSVRYQRNQILDEHDVADRVEVDVSSARQWTIPLE